MIYRLELTMEQLVLLGGLVNQEVNSLEKHCEETLRAIHKHEDMEVPTSINSSLYVTFSQELEDFKAIYGLIVEAKALCQEKI